METWSEDELVARWRTVSSELIKLTEEVSPTLLKLSKLEREIQVLQQEILRRGTKVDGGR
jgi:hypothetical protein